MSNSQNCLFKMSNSLHVTHSDDVEDTRWGNKDADLRHVFPGIQPAPIHELFNVATKTETQNRASNSLVCRRFCWSNQLRANCHFESWHRLWGHRQCCLHTCAGFGGHEHMATCVHCRRTMDQSLRQSIWEHRGCRDKCKCRSLCSTEDLSQHCSHDSESLVRSSTLLGLDSLTEIEGIWECHNRSAQGIHLHCPQGSWERARNRRPHLCQDRSKPLCLFNSFGCWVCLSCESTPNHTFDSGARPSKPGVRAEILHAKKRRGSCVKNTMTPHWLFEPSMLAKEASPYVTSWAEETLITPLGYLKVVSENRWALREIALSARASATVGALERCAARFTSYDRSGRNWSCNHWSFPDKLRYSLCSLYVNMWVHTIPAEQEMRPQVLGWRSKLQVSHERVCHKKTKSSSFRDMLNSFTMASSNDLVVLQRVSYA